jgi:AcrR family transcriptional regulator
MGNREIQEQRIRGYFVQATKEILKSEGLKSLSVRNIAQKAGYSFATIYNYYRDVKDLIFECVKDFQEEAEAFVKDQITETEPGISRIKAISLAYVKFFVEYPGIFELFYIEKVYNLAGKQPTIDLINTFLDRLCMEDWKQLELKKTVSKEDAEERKIKIRITTIGLLLFYLHRQYPSDYNEFLKLTTKEIDDILKE